MRIIPTTHTDQFIQKLKCIESSGAVRLTFQWPADIEQLYIFKSDKGFEIETASFKDAMLFTLQEYKKQAGFLDRKQPGVHTYYLYPFFREDGEDICLVQSDGGNQITCKPGQVVIRFSLKDKKSLFGNDKQHDIVLLSEQPVAAEVLCYVKKENGYPADIHDGTIYYFGEPLMPGQTSRFQVKTRKNEFIRLFIKNEEQAELYSLQMM